MAHRVVIRADGSPTIGSGHLMRMLTLADVLRSGGAEVSFVCRQHPGAMTGAVRQRGFALASLPEPASDFETDGTPAHARWIGASWQDDAQQTGLAIGELPAKPDWLIVDHYGLDERWETALRPSADRIFCIDDLADRRHDCDLLLDQNLVEEGNTRYAGKVSADAAVMLGPAYALLQPQYAQLHDRVQPRQGPVRRILIYFGSADRRNLTQSALQAFLALRRDDIEVDVVVSDADVVADAVQASVADRPNVRVHRNVPSLAELMAAADLAIGAAGTTSWERLCLGLPALVVTLAANQEPIARALHEHGLVRWLGTQEDVSSQVIQGALAAEIERGCDTHCSALCRETVDGAGAQRVAGALLLNSETILSVRFAEPSDEALLLEWANDRQTRLNSFSPAVIAKADHHRWFANKLQNVAGCKLFIVEAGPGVPVGQVRFDREREGWRISYSIAAPCRGKGVGCRALDAALRRFETVAPGARLFGEVAAANRASHRIFLKLGFAPVDRPHGTVEYRKGF